MKKFSFSKFAGLQRVTWLKMNCFRNIVQGSWSYIPEHLFFQIPLTRSFRFACICTLYKQIITLQLLSFTIILSLFEDLIKNNSTQPTQIYIWNQSKEARRQLGVYEYENTRIWEYAHEQQSNFILPCFDWSKHDAYLECYK